MRCSDVIRLVFFLMTPLQIYGDEKRGSPQGGTGNAKPKHDIRSVSGLRRIRRFCVLRLVDKASAGGVFYFYSHSIFTDFKEIVFVIFDVAVRSSFLIEEIASVASLPFYAGRCFVYPFQRPSVKKGVIYAIMNPRPLRIAHVMMIRLSQDLDSSTVLPLLEKFISKSATDAVTTAAMVEMRRI